MSNSLKFRLTGLALLAMLLIGVFWISPLSSLWAHIRGARAVSLTFHQTQNGPYTVKGNTIVGADGTAYLFHGVGRDGLEFLCKGDGFFDAGHLAFLGPGSSGPGGTYWYGNTVRLPLSEGFWLKGDATQGCTAAQYQALVKSTVDSLTAMKMNVIIDLQWTDAGGQYGGGGAGWELPDADSVTFWTQAATAYKSYINVLFELYNEPHPPTWSCWLSGCAITNDTTCCGQSLSYTGVGMQALVNAVRGTGASNLAIVGGMNWGYDLSQIATNAITGSNIVYDTHPYPYPLKQPADWDTYFGNISATHPVVSLENGEYDCGSSYMTQLYDYLDAHNIGWMGWAWYNVGPNPNSGCGYPELILDYSGTPSPSMGTTIYQRLLSYAGITPPPNPSPTPTIPPATGPVSQQWYFAEGRVGKGFTEWLTLGNPTASTCSVSIRYMYQLDSGAAGTKTLTVSVPSYHRITRNVDADLGTTPTGQGIVDSAFVTASGCPGIVAERPMYFKTQLVNSGSDTLGATQSHLGTTFYFADLAAGSQPGGGSYASFLPILNPGGSAATVTATYYAGGKQVSSQQVNVPAGARGTIFPAQANPRLPSRVSVVLSSTQPVMIERPTYFNGINGGAAGAVSGAADIQGVNAPATDWLFAEGYTGGQFQETFVIANFDARATATVTITLEYSNGSTHPSTVQVAPLSQLSWNVNAAAGAGQSLSAEISSTGASIVAEREMYFKYNRMANGRTLSAQGGTDVLGQKGPAAASAYSFAEGYTAVGFDEYLTIQNPTANPETITVTLANGFGTVYTTSVAVNAHSRYTMDIVKTVLQFLYHGPVSAGYEVTMALQSSSGPFVAERPMYWNVSGTQGGTDIIGYIGG